MQTQPEALFSYYTSRLSLMGYTVTSMSRRWQQPEGQYIQSSTDETYTEPQFPLRLRDDTEYVTQHYRTYVNPSSHLIGQRSEGFLVIIK